MNSVHRPEQAELTVEGGRFGTVRRRRLAGATAVGLSTAPGFLRPNTAEVSIDNVAEIGNRTADA